MADDTALQHFHNTSGVAKISIGTKQFQCIGALPPYDHPHVFLNMGADNEIICPYCSTHYSYENQLSAGESSPPNCTWHKNNQ